MSIVLQEINEPPQETVPEDAEPEVIETEIPEEIPQEIPEEIPEPVPKKRGRPPKAKSQAAPKAPAVKAPAKAKPVKKKPAPPPSESSEEDVDETLKNVYNHVAKPDMETAILQFLVNRRQTESQRRRTLWSQMAHM